MGSTTVDFRGQKYEASDGTIEIWMHFIVVEMDKEPQVSPWLQEVRDDWHILSIAGFNFGVMPDLDRFVTTEAQRETILHLSECALEALEQQGPMMSEAALNALASEGSFYTADVPTEVFLRVGRYFVKLLQGTLAPEENDSRMYNW